MAAIFISPSVEDRVANFFSFFIYYMKANQSQLLNKGAGSINSWRF